MILSTVLRAGLALIAAGLLAACSNLGLNEADDKAARRAYEQIRSNDLAGLDSWSGAEMKAVDPKVWADVRALIPPGPPKSVSVTGWKYNMATGSGNVLVTTHQYDYSDRKVLAETVMRRGAPGAAWTVAGFHVKTEPLTPAASSDSAAKTAPAGS